MSEDAMDADGEESTDVGRTATDATDPVASVEAYREDDTVVLYDAHNPLAWVETTVAVSLADRT